MLPDAPERLLASGEREQEHRHELERRLVGLDEGSMPQFYKGQRRAHLVALVLGFAYLAVMALAIFEGEETWGIVGAAGGLAALVWAARRDPTGSEDLQPSTPDPQAPDAHPEESSEKER